MTRPPTIAVNDARELDLDPELPDDIVRGVSAALASGRPDGTAPESVEISVTLVGPDDMRGLNSRYHAVDASTDVLAFALGEGDTLIGDIYICPDVAAGSASEHGETPEAEMVRLAVHGTLHLLGHDHPEGDDRYESPMFRLQERILLDLP